MIESIQKPGLRHRSSVLDYLWTFVVARGELALLACLAYRRSFREPATSQRYINLFAFRTAICLPPRDWPVR